MLTPVFSLYLDLARFGAAFVVAMSHVWPMLFPEHPLPWPGHDAVVIFFVLSGLVIAHATDRPDRTFSIYIQHRAARIGSVAIPALLLSMAIAPAIPSDITIYAAPVIADSHEFWTRLALNAVFLGQSWSLDLSPPINAPYWSLNFEIWYYVFYGVWTYCALRWKVPLALLAALIAGPKILMLMPIWYLGVAIYRIKFLFSERVALLLFVATIVGGLAYFWFDISILIRSKMIALWPGFMATLHGSNQFVGDTLLGLIVATNFVAASRLSNNMRHILRFQRPIKFASSFTFSTYLYHMPMFSFLWGVANFRSPLLILPLLALGVAVLGQFTERQLPVCRRMLERAPIWPLIDKQRRLQS